MYFHMSCCAASAVGSFEFQVCTTEVCVAVVGFFSKHRLIRGAMVLLDHSPFLKTTKLDQFTHTHLPSSVTAPNLTGMNNTPSC